jgi:hypothetical protein
MRGAKPFLAPARVRQARTPKIYRAAERSAGRPLSSRLLQQKLVDETDQPPPARRFRVERAKTSLVIAMRFRQALSHWKTSRPWLGRSSLRRPSKSFVAVQPTRSRSDGTATVEEIARVPGRPPWYQLYVSRDRGATRDEAQRAENAGYRVLFVTVDGAAAGVRNSMMRPPFRAVATPGELRTGADTSLAWKDIAWLRSFVRIPIVLKGIIDPRDAERAVAEGVAGIDISNHGGRQLDTAAATIDALPAVVEKVAGRIPVLMDGGVRRGTDVLKAIARGASGVMIGRPFLYGLGVAGADGVERVVTILRQEFEMAMALYESQGALLRVDGYGTATIGQREAVVGPNGRHHSHATARRELTPEAHASSA